MVGVPLERTKEGPPSEPVYHRGGWSQTIKHHNFFIGHGGQLGYLVGTLRNVGTSEASKRWFVERVFRRLPLPE